MFAVRSDDLTRNKTRSISVETARVIDRIVDATVDAYGGVDNPDLVHGAAGIAASLPEELWEACAVGAGRAGYHVVSGFTVVDSVLGPTPRSWRTSDSTATARWDVLMVLLAHVYGCPFAWAGQQDGRLVNDIVPSPGQEADQTGASSTTLLEPHTEDAFHPGRCHLLILAGLRNPDGIGTTLSSVRDVELEPADWVELASPTVPILPDASYEANPAVQGQASETPSVPTVWARDDGVCLRYDPAYTPLDAAPRRYREAYQRLTDELQRHSHAVAVAPGELLVLDNDVVVHGRVPFTPRYDGTDRWLKRINVRVPDRFRPAAEDFEDGYGEELVDPLSAHPADSTRGE